MSHAYQAAAAARPGPYSRSRSMPSAQSAQPTMPAMSARGASVSGPDPRGAGGGPLGPRYRPSPHQPDHRPDHHHQYNHKASSSSSSMTDQMAAMNVNGRNAAMNGRNAAMNVNGRNATMSETHRLHANYGPPMDTQFRPAPPPEQPPSHQVGRAYAGPVRAVTMPYDHHHHHHHQLPPSNAPLDNLPYNTPAARTAPSRPATTTGTRPPPPQRSYPSHDGTFSRNPPYPGQPHGAANFNGSQVSVTQVFEDYYDSAHTDPYKFTPNHSPPPLHDMPAPPLHNGWGRSSFDDARSLQQEQSHRGAHHTPRLGHAKSMAEMRQPQSAVFEMASDIPSVPPIPPHNAIMHPQQHYDPSPPPQIYRDSFDQSQTHHHSYGQAISCDQVPLRGPSAPPASGRSPYYGSASASSSSASTPAPGADTMPHMRPMTQTRISSDYASHPTPVRPGQIANSLVDRSAKPPPVRNYGGIAQPQHHHAQNAQNAQNVQNVYGRQYTPSSSSSTASVVRVQQEEEEGPVTAHELERDRMVIKTDPSDEKTALRLSRRLIEAADVLAPRLPDPRSRTKARERYLIDSHKILKKLVNHQNAEAMFTLADCIGKGVFGNDMDTKEAFILYHSAAKMGHPAAAYRTAVCCEIGHEEGGGTRRDAQKAIQWYKRAATLGDPPAMYKMGMVTLKGLLGQNKNPREAVGWLKRAADRADAANPHALHELGLLFESAQPNDFLVRDEAYALRLFQQAAELGYKFSQFRLGCAYEFGVLGLPFDPHQSIYWYSKAALQEEHQSELALSGWYLTGVEGALEQNDSEAYLWARKAAVSGMAKAEFAMGYFTEVGIGTAPNLEDAKRWYWRAAAQDFPQARERLEELKRASKSEPRPRERISRSNAQEGDCSIM